MINVFNVILHFLTLTSPGSNPLEQVRQGAELPLKPQCLSHPGIHELSPLCDSSCTEPSPCALFHLLLGTHLSQAPNNNLLVEFFLSATITTSPGRKLRLAVCHLRCTTSAGAWSSVHLFQKSSTTD